MGKQLVGLRTVRPDCVSLDYQLCHRAECYQRLCRGLDVYAGEGACVWVAWGVGATLFGLGISRVGMALGFALILGITASFGSLLPLALLHPDQLAAKHGLALIVGTAVMVAGLVFLALAGRTREHDLATAPSARSGFTAGLVICIFSGIFSSMLNFSFVFGDELRLRALQAGASNAMAANPIWGLTVTGGFVANFLYCVYLLQKNRTWSVFREGRPSTYWLLGVSMGLLWYGGIVVYGMGAASLGTLGGIVGWPIFMTIDIIAALFWGAISGEWKGASRRALAYNWAGVALLLVAIAIIPLGTQPSAARRTRLPGIADRHLDPHRTDAASLALINTAAFPHNVVLIHGKIGQRLD